MRLFLCFLLVWTFSAYAEIPPEGCGPLGCGNIKDHSIHLTLNHHEGLFLEFSNGKTYEIAPDDQFYAAYWITPFPAEFDESDDPDYPVKITDLYTGTSVRGKEVSTREILKEEIESQQEESAPSTTTPVEPPPRRPAPRNPNHPIEPPSPAPKNPNPPPKLELNLQ